VNLAGELIDGVRQFGVGDAGILPQRRDLAKD
jgi:hypothetical protein